MEVTLVWVEGGKAKNVHFDTRTLPEEDMKRIENNLLTNPPLGWVHREPDLNMCYEAAAALAVKKHIGFPDWRDPKSRLTLYVTPHKTFLADHPSSSSKKEEEEKKKTVNDKDGDEKRDVTMCLPTALLDTPPSAPQ
jgi:hypothetical protein